MSFKKWKEVRLGDICTLNYGKALTAKNRIDGDIPVYSSAGITGRHNAPLVESEGVIIGRKGSVGTVYYSSTPFFCIDTAYYVLPSKEYSLKYLFYRLKSLRLEALNEDSAVPGLNRETAYSQFFLLPPYDEQLEIESILSSLDDKIEQNRMINDNLEKQGKILFEQLFFINAVSSWKEGTLSDIAFINPTRTLKKGTVATYVGMANLSTHGPFPSNWDSKAFTGGMKFTNGDTLMARITPCLENGKTAYVNFLQDAEVAFGSTEYIVISPKPGYCNEMFYFLARKKEFVNYAIGNMNGTSGRQRVTGEDIGKYELKIPSQDSLQEFAAFAAPAMNIIKANSIENRVLSELRDSILPRLMSGEIDISQINL